MGLNSPMKNLQKNVPGGYGNRIRYFNNKYTKYLDFRIHLLPFKAGSQFRVNITVMQHCMCSLGALLAQVLRL